MLPRLLATQIAKDLDNKIIVLSGPRQCGKTTLSKALHNSFDYFNYDSAEDRSRLKRKEWDRKSELIIFDELHKMNKWKSWLKGIYDTEGIRPRLLVTGSAKLNQFRKAGDSLAGRHLSFRLHPFDLKEWTLNQRLQSSIELSIEEAFERLMLVGGFPEPFLDGSKKYYNRWRKSHIDIILRQDMLDLDAVRDIGSLETLIYLLSERIGSPISYTSLATALDKDPKTIKRWLEVLEHLYIVFKVAPYHKDISRSIKKESKYYFYDNGLVRGDEGAKIENIVACGLLKEIHRLEDVEGHTAQLNYLRSKNGKEIDFLITIEDMRPWLIEVKLSDEHISSNFKTFAPHFKSAHLLQLVRNLDREYTTSSGLEVRKLAPWLSSLELT